MSIAIKVENLSKAYRLGEIGTGTLYQDLQRWWAKQRGQEDPYLKIGEANDREIKGTSDVVWSLKNINFEIQKGDAVGIIGRNGAGKSTLLKLLSRITSPTAGTITGDGRIASLLEVGTGFHPELTGRENIFLNGAILGMRKKEIKRKFDEIVDFSGVERYINTPVKRYSSGMYVRLAFAVAAHLESEILIVDEVLAVGDAEFQKKCLGKMGEVSKGEGRTVLFVSHNMGAVAQLCTKGIFLRNGQIEYSGDIKHVVDKYLSNASNKSLYIAEDDNEKSFQILSVQLSNTKGVSDIDFDYNEEINVVFKIKNFAKEKGIRCAVGICDQLDQLITINRISVSPQTGYQTFKVTIPKAFFVPNKLKLSVAFYIPQRGILDITPELLPFRIIDTGSESAGIGEHQEGYVFSSFHWSVLD